MRLARIPSQQRVQQSHAALESVGLLKRSHHRGMELSGGEQQRVALARALVHMPRFLIADEPTGNLDSHTGRDITRLLRDVSREAGISLLIATHDLNVVNAADRVLQIQDGKIVS